MTHYILDCDDVLLDWQAGFLSHVRKCGFHPDPAGPTTWDMSEWLGTSAAYTRQLVSDFNMSPKFGKLAPCPNAISTVQWLWDEGQDITVLTACGNQAQTIELRKQNIEHHFGNLFDNIAFLPLGSSKFDWLYRFSRNHKDCVMVEDNFKHAQAAAVNGMTSYCIRKSHNRFDEAENRDTKVTWIDDISEVDVPILIAQRSF